MSDASGYLTRGDVHIASMDPARFRDSPAGSAGTTQGEEFAGTLASEAAEFFGDDDSRGGGSGDDDDDDVEVTAAGAAAASHAGIW